MKKIILTLALAAALAGSGPAAAQEKPSAWGTVDQPLAIEPVEALAPSAPPASPTYVGEEEPEKAEFPTLPPAEARAAAPAAETPREPAAAPAGFSSYGLDMVKALGAFIVVLVLLVLALKLLGRLGRFRGGKGAGRIFELRDTLALDNRKYLAAVEVDGRLLVIGVSPDRLTPLAQWLLDDEDEGETPAASDFRLPDDFLSKPGRPDGEGDGDK